MKKLYVTLKSSSEVLNDFKKNLKKMKKGQLKDPHFEISFDSRKNFETFVKNIHILSSVLHFKPQSVYELSKLVNMDVSNLNKIILFFEKMGAIKIEKKEINGRAVKRPKVPYQQIVFDLKSA